MNTHEIYFEEMFKRSSDKTVFNYCEPFRFRMAASVKINYARAHQTACGLNEKIDSLTNKLIIEKWGKNHVSIDDNFINFLNSDESRQKFNNELLEGAFKLFSAYMPSPDTSCSWVGVTFYREGRLGHHLHCELYSMPFICVGMDNKNLFYLNNNNVIRTVSANSNRLEFLEFAK